MNAPNRLLPAVLALHLLACGGATAPNMSTPTAPVCGSPGTPACPTSPPVAKPRDPNYGAECTSNSDCGGPDNICWYIGDGRSQCLAKCGNAAAIADQSMCPSGTVCDRSYLVCHVACASDMDCRDTEYCGGTGTCLLRPDSTGGGAGGGGGTTGTTVNQAEALWKAQEDVYQTSENLRDTWGVWMIGWLRDARSAAGASGNITTGTLTQTSSGSFTYSPGTQPLRIVKANGYSFSIIVQQLVGSVASTSFPSGSDHVVGTFDMGSYSMKVDITEKTAAFDGDEFDDAGERTTVHVRHTKEKDSFAGNGTYFLELNDTFSGTVARGNTLVSYSTKKWMWTCNGTNCLSNGTTLDLDHDVTVTSPSGTWNLVYSTGFDQPSGALATYAWEGRIWSGSAEVGGLAKRKVGTVSELNVFVGSDLYRVRTVTEP